MTLPSNERPSVTDEPQAKPFIPDRTLESLLLSLDIRFKQMKDFQHTSISYGEIKTLLDGYRELQKLRIALTSTKEPVRASHHYQCSAVRGMERDCHCGAFEANAQLRALADVVGGE